MCIYRLKGFRIPTFFINIMPRKPTWINRTHLELQTNSVCGMELLLKPLIISTIMVSIEAFVEKMVSIDYSYITLAENFNQQSIPAFNSRRRGVSSCSGQWPMPVEKFLSSCQSAQSIWVIIGSICDLWAWIKLILGNIPHHYSSLVTKISNIIVVYVLCLFSE